MLDGKVVGALWKEILLESHLYLERLEITVVQGIKAFGSFVPDKIIMSWKLIMIGMLADSLREIN